MDCFALLLVSSTAYFLVASASVPLRVVTSGLFRGKKTSKIGTFDAIIVKQKRMSATKAIYVFQRISLRSSLFKYIFSGNKWTHFIESSHQWFFRDKKRLWGYYSKAKTEKYNRRNSCLFDTFRMFIPC